MTANTNSFDVKTFIDSFWNEPGLRRSLDKVYEIVVFALFSTLVDSMDMQIQISINKSNLPLLQEFEDFSKKVMCLDTSNPISAQNARIYRVGITNAADRGLDMYSNWGPAIQIKHLTLNTELAESIVGSVSSEKIIIVCKDIEKKIIVSLLSQIGWNNRIQSIITENDLILWYEKALRGTYSTVLGKQLLATLCEQISEEFPSVDDIPEVLRNRHYERFSEFFST